MPKPNRSDSPNLRWPEIAASFVVPGAGQWMQSRFATGTILFTAALLLGGLGWGPVLWASIGPKMDVHQGTQHLAIFDWLALSLVAAVDAFNFSRRR